MIRIYADSTNDLGAELIEKNKVRIVPLYVRMGEETVKDGPSLDPDELYAWADKNKTSVFKVAAEDVDYSDHVFVVDSRNLSTGIGLVILKAAKMIEEGNRTAAEIWLELQKIIPKVRASFVVDTLLYLYRGGRCSAVSALAASALGIKPKIIVADGKMSVGAKYRGKIEAVIKKYVKDLEPQLKKADRDAVFITHSGVDASISEAVKAELAELKHFDNIYVTRAGGVISSHCGPGTLGVLFIEND